MHSLTSMCPNLKMLAYKAKDQYWHSSTPAWPLLEELYLDYQFRDYKYKEDPFYKVELHRYLPNLKILFLTNNGFGRSVLPDMRGCDKLEHVHLNKGFFVNMDPRVKMPFINNPWPFPKTLKKLTGLTRLTGFWCFMYEDDQVDSGSKPEYVRIYGPKIMELVKKQMPECEVVVGWDDSWEGFTFKRLSEEKEWLKAIGAEEEDYEGSSSDEEEVQTPKKSK